MRTHSPAAAAPPRDAPAAGLLGVFREDLGELPLGYGDGRLVTLVRDPATLFIYWDFSPHQIEQGFAGLGSARALLRLWNGRQQGGEPVREVEVSLDARSWYLRELPAGVELRVELWAVGEKGARMLRAARPTKLPQALPSTVLEEFYANLALEVPLLKDGQFTGGRPLAWISGSAPIGWERRLQPRHGDTTQGSPTNGRTGRPWSMTHLRDLDDEDDR